MIPAWHPGPTPVCLNVSSPTTARYPGWHDEQVGRDRKIPAHLCQLKALAALSRRPALTGGQPGLWFVFVPN